jgi:(p)ppGpp synthase/HD superfamily hydrolase
MEMQEGGNSEEFIESVKVDLFPDKVYVFTPKGDILRLPRGATVVDFAYAVHTDVGNRCVAAKVDRRLSPLRTVLRNGQTVRDHHRQGRDAQSVVGELRRHRQGAQRDPPLPQGLLNSALEEFRGDRIELGKRLQGEGLAGTEGLLVTYSRCCRPIPNDPIIAFLQITENKAETSPFMRPTAADQP